MEVSVEISGMNQKNAKSYKRTAEGFRWFSERFGGVSVDLKWFWAVSRGFCSV